MSPARSSNTAINVTEEGVFDTIGRLNHFGSTIQRFAFPQDPMDHPRIENAVRVSARILEVYRLVARVAPTKSTVLIQGDTGTGKELIARAIHHNSPRAEHPLVAIDCGALAESLLESELFGHVKGAFTGAVAEKRGLFEAAHGGTCFLDEAGEISPSMQAKLLRVLQEHEVKRVGGTESLKVDARVIAATNKDLSQQVSEGKFREDLLYGLYGGSARSLLFPRGPAGRKIHERDRNAYFFLGTARMAPMVNPPSTKSS